MKIIKVLVACEESQAIAMAFNKRANMLSDEVKFFAMSCDLQDCSGGHPEYHHKGDAIEFIKSFEPHLLIAHPPCTYLSNAGSNSLVRYINGQKFVNLERYSKGLEAADFFYSMLELGKQCGKYCIENPVPGSIWELPRPNQIVQPYEYGHDVSKKTYLWHNMPPLVPTEIVEDHVSYLVGGTYKDGRKYSGVRSAKKRSKTFIGIANAMADQWGSYLVELAMKGEL